MIRAALSVTLKKAEHLRLTGPLMELKEVLDFLNEYGFIFLFVVVFFEYINAPGLPAAVVFPAIGVWLSSTDKSVIVALVISEIAALAASLLVYAIGWKGGPPLLRKIQKKSPKAGDKIQKYMEKLRKRANMTVFVAKLIPLMRNLVDLPAGAIRMNVVNFLLFAGLGIMIWNSVLMLSGVFFGDMIFNE